MRRTAADYLVVEMLDAQGLPSAAVGTPCAVELAAFRDELVVALADALLGPVTCIVGFAELLAGDLAGRATGEQRVFLESILRNSELLLLRFSALLDATS